MVDRMLSVFRVFQAPVREKVCNDSNMILKKSCARIPILYYLLQKKVGSLANLSYLLQKIQAKLFSKSL